MRISTGYKVNRRLVAFMTALVVLVVSTLPQSIRAYADTDINQDGVFFAGFEEIFEQQVSENDISGDTTSGNSISGNTVILLMNGGDLNDADKAAGLYTQSTTGDYTFVLQESLNPALPYPVKQDMIFDGWYLEPVEEKSTDTARTQTKVADIATLEESIRSGAVIPVDGAVVLYPGWTRDYYTLRFFDSDGSSEILPQIKVSKNVTTKEVKEVVDKTVNIVRDGYQVVWNRYRFDANGNRRIDDGGTRVPRQTVDQILKSTRNINRDFDFIAEWNAQPYTYEIEYLLDGGHFANADVSAGKVPKDFSIQSPDIVIPSPIRIGYHFAGWYLNSEHTIPVTGIASGTKGADSDAEGKVETYKLYATWVETSAAVPELLSMSYVSKGKISFSFGPADKAIRYEAAVSSSSDFSENVNVILFDKEGTYTVNNLLKKKYYVRVRSITRDSIGELIYSEWSQAKSAKVKSGVSEVKAQTGLIKLKKVNVQSGKLVIKAKAKKRLKSDDESYYLVKVNPLNGKYVKKTVTAASPKTSVVTFKLPLDDEDTAPGLLQGKYAIAIKKGGKYKLMTGAKYVKNPEAAATYTEAFPKAASKKGLQGEAAGEVGTKHVFNNYYVDEFMPSGADPVVTYVYNGKSYYFNQNMLKDITSWVSKANSKSQVATAQFMLKWPSANSKLVLSGGRSQGSAPNGLYAMSIQTKEAREYYEAFFSFLSGYLAKSDCHLDNWILGNEVNMYNDWYYAGSSSKSDIVANYAGV
ncbi:MAG: InlB B-repeat-containing protein, partial [Lachnospiraceae bacterium]|nr:InlB B-repeat-containing protein [Lachnospiraceae bacterium]